MGHSETQQRQTQRRTELESGQNIEFVEDVEDTDYIEVHNFGVKVGKNGNGYGSKLVELLAASYNVEVHDVIEGAEGFWAKMAERYNVEIIEE